MRCLALTSYAGSFAAVGTDLHLANPLRFDLGTTSSRPPFQDLHQAIESLHQAPIHVLTLSHQAGKLSRRSRLVDRYHRYRYSDQSRYARQDGQQPDVLGGR